MANPNDLEIENPKTPFVSQKTRADVVAELQTARAARNPLLANDSDRSRSYNPFGVELKRPSVVARADVKNEVLQAVRDGTLPRTDYEYDNTVARTHRAAPAQPVLAAR